LKYHLILFMKKDTMKTKALQTLAVMGIASIAFAGAASASTFTVYATGFTAGYGSEIPVNVVSGTQDGNFTLTGIPGPGVSPGTLTPTSAPTYVLPYSPVAAPGYQFPTNNYGVIDSANAEWIAPQATYAGPGGTRLADPSGLFEYQTTFSLTGYDPTSAVLNGEWAADNQFYEILINGNAVYGPGLSGSDEFNTLSAYSASGPGVFTSGTNTIDFITYNTGGPTALYTFGAITANATPEPSPLVALGVGLLGVGMMMVRKRRIS
jgi:hypothetical protein